MKEFIGKTFVILLCLVGTTSQSYWRYKCVDCYRQDGGQWCLHDDRLQEGTCCNDNLPLGQRTEQCKTQSNNQFCVKKGKIDNDILGAFACPAQEDKCPSAQSDVLVEIGEAGKTYYREYKWANRQIPDEDALAWNCKYVIRAQRSLVSQADPSTRGYIMLQVEQYGFDEEVFLIVQEHGKYRDFVFTKPDNVTKIYLVRFGQRFYVPAEYDLLLSFEPVRRLNGVFSQAGKLRLRTWLQKAIAEEEVLAANTRILLRPQSNLKINSTDDKENKKGGYLDSGDAGGPKVNWDGEAVSDGPWLEQELFRVADTPITNKDVVVGSTILLIIIMIIVVICLGISWWKRKAIAEGVRRASTYVVRASQRLRRSIRAKLGRDEAEEAAEESPSPGALGRNKREVAFLQDLFQRQNAPESERQLRAEKYRVELAEAKETTATSVLAEAATQPKLGSVMRKQKTFLADLATHHNEVDGGREMSFGKRPAPTTKARKTVTFVEADDDMEFEEGQNYGDEERKKSMDKFFSKAAADPEKVRGLTMIKDLLVDFENASDFVVSESSRPANSDLQSIQEGSAGKQANGLRRGTIDSKGGPFKAAPQLGPEDPEQGKPDQAVQDLIQQSKNLLFDLKLLEDRNENQARRLEDEQQDRGQGDGAEENASDASPAFAFEAAARSGAPSLGIPDEESARPTIKHGDAQRPSKPLELNVGSVIDLLDDNDADFRHFLQRKATIMTNISQIAAQKYQDDESKREGLISQVAAALDQEETQYRKTRQTMKRTLRRQTLQRKDLTKEERERLQEMDFEYQLCAVTDSNVGSQVPACNGTDLDKQLGNDNGDR